MKSESKSELSITCISCPMGCELSVGLENAAVVSVEGNRCRRGREYAELEAVHPTRFVTTTVRTVFSGMLPVKTKDAIPKGKIFECVRALKDVTVTSPVRIGDVIFADVAGTGVDVVATKALPNDL